MIFKSNDFIKFFVAVTIIFLFNNTAFSTETIVFPAQGQSNEQMEKDKYDCYQWAQQEAGQYAQNRDTYNRAHSACLEGKGYTVK